MQVIINIVKESWYLFFQMSTYLILGLFVAGLIHIFLKPETIFRHLGKPGFLSIVKAVLFGVPLPLCSCGVLPPAASFYRSGASKGSVLAFLISTPTTGIDSIFATYGLLGGVFMLFRIMAAVVIGFIAGILTDIFETTRTPSEKQLSKGSFSCSDSTVIGGLRYAFVDLYGSIVRWIFWGVLIGGIISYLVPVEFVSKYLSNRYISYLLMLAIGTPLYVCATGSIPIAASLIAKGMSPGAGLVFLITGPATNAVTILFVGKTLGRKSFTVYITSIMVGAIFFGYMLDIVAGHFNLSISAMAHRHEGSSVFSYISSFILIILAINYGIISIKQKFITGKLKNCFVFDVPDISCNNCARIIKKVLSPVDGVQSVDVDIRRKKVRICCTLDNTEKIKEILESAGYPVSK